jgi:antitoxin component YwqK of YwqJK toxin-antitoxin module
MVYNLFSENYYLKLKRLLPFSSLVLIFFLLGCDASKEAKEEVPTSLTYDVLTFYKNGKAKEQESFTNNNGIREIYGYEELYPDGSVKITGRLSKTKHRDGLWKSFYEDGKPWSIGSYTEGVETGEKKVWYPNGKIRYKGTMVKGKPSGVWFFWDEKGVKTEKKY